LQNAGEPTTPVGELVLTITITLPEEAQQSSETVGAEPTLFTPQSGVQKPFEPAPGHDLPTVASSNADLRAPEIQRQPLPPQKKRTSLPMTAGIISGLIVLLLLAGTVYLYNSRQSNANALLQSQTATALAQTPKHTPTARITPTARPSNGLYIAGTYNGSMNDATTQQASSISVLIEQSKGSGILNGKFTFRSPSQGAYSLKGIVDTQGNFSFTVQQPAGQQPLYYYGKVQQGSYLRGFFCRSSTNSCSGGSSYFLVGPRF